MCQNNCGQSVSPCMPNFHITPQNHSIIKKINISVNDLRDPRAKILTTTL